MRKKTLSPASIGGIDAIGSAYAPKRIEGDCFPEGFERFGR
jgi:hypothetical protein